MTHCKFATMSKANYQKVLSKIQQQNREKMINFLKQIPFISHMSKNTIGKIMYAIEKVPFIRGQNVVKEGDPAEYIYIVNQGEYEVIKYLGKGEEENKVKSEEEELIRPLLAHEEAKRCQAVKLTKEWHNPSRVQRRIRLCVLGECKLF